MAIVNITLIEGRSEEVKDRLISAVTQALVDELDAKPEQVRVVLNEVADGSYAVGGRRIWLHK